VKEEFVSESILRKPGTPRRFSAAISAASFRDKAEGLLCAVLKVNFGLGAKAFRVSSSLSCRALIAYRHQWVVSLIMDIGTSAYVLWS
jgi:hypothetical protein